jgi:hypothetical protein
MDKISLSKRIENYLKRRSVWVHRGVIEDLAKNATYYKKGKLCHYLAENANRRCREMVEGKKSDGTFCKKVLEVRPCGNSVEYRYKNDIIKPKQKVEIRDGIAYLL